MNQRHAISLLVALCAPIAAHAADLACFEDEVSNAVTCFSQKSLKVQAGLASALMFTGGPKRVTATGYTIVVQCASGITHLKDRNGVSFASGRTTDTSALSAIAGWMCEPPPPKKK